MKGLWGARLGRPLLAASLIAGLAVVCLFGLGDLVLVPAHAAPRNSLGTTSPGAAAVSRAAEARDQAVVDLLMLDSRLTTSKGHVAEAEQALHALDSDITTATAARDRARSDLEATRARLSTRLRATYKARGLGWLELLAGSANFNQLVLRIGALGRIFEAEDSLAHQIETARDASVRTEADLRAARVAQEAKLREARQARDELARVRTDQAALVARLGGRLQEAQAAANAAQARMDAINRDAQSQSPPSRATPTTRPSEGRGDTTAPTTSRPDASRPHGRQFEAKVTAYALPGTTATGVSVRYGIIAVDPRVIPLGTRLYVPGYGEGIAADTGGDIKGNWIDVWLPSEAQALDWGVKHLTVTILD